MVAIQKKIIISFLFLILLVIPIVIAQPPTTTIQIFQEEGLTIKYPIIDYHEKEKDLFLRFHVFNTSNGIVMSNSSVSCKMHLYNTTGKSITGADDIDITVGACTRCWKADIASGNFTTLGNYYYFFHCNTSDLGGFVSANFLVTYNGLEPPTDFTKVAFIIGFIILLCLVVITLFKIIGHFAEFDVDILDTAYAFCIYFAVFAVKSFNLTYGGNALIDTFMDLFIKFGAITHIFLPLIALILSITLGEWFRMQRAEKGRLKQHG